jgi:F-type H+-transporting ATPase subunit b
MDQILNQLGGLFVGSLPTIVLFLLLLAAYGVLVRGPLDRVLAKRRELTTGAMEQAQSAIGQAESETALFEEKLRAARTELFNAREARLKQWAAEREQALTEARLATQAKVAEARLALEQSAAVGRQQIESMSGELSAQVLKAVMPAGVAGTGAAQ